MPHAHAGDLDIWYEVHGSGKPVVMLPGTGFDSTLWMLHLPWLADGRSVVTMDYRDSGRSSYVDEDYTPADLARDVALVMREAEIEAADVVGWSLGGAVALELALAEPDLVRRLVLVCSWARGNGWSRHKCATWERVALAGDRDLVLRYAALDLFTDDWFEVPGAFEMLEAMSAATPHPQRPDGFARQWRADAAHDVVERLPKISCPVLVVGAERDVLVPARYARELADAIPGARFELVPGAAHGFLIEQPDAFRAVVEPFLAGA